MKKIYFLVFVFCSLFSFFSQQQCYGQTPDWVWAKGAHNSSSAADEGQGIATDKSNNIYITGMYGDTITFDSFILTNQFGAACYLAKYDASGNVIWARSSVNIIAGGSEGINVCTDVFGNTYITGFFGDGTISFGTDIIINTSAGGFNIFLVKYDSSGNSLWARSAGGMNIDKGYGVSADRSGNVYITGSFSSPSITFGSYTLNNATNNFGNRNVFIVKYDSSGNVLWAKNAGGTMDDFATSISTDALANSYVTGHFSSPSITFGSYTLTNIGSDDVFLVKYDSSGSVLWAKSAGGIGGVDGWYVAADSLGNLYLTGYYDGPFITFGSDTLINSGAFLAKYDSSGNASWAKSIIGIGNVQGYCVATDKTNNIYISGMFDSLSVTFDNITVQRPAVYKDPMFVAGYDSSGHAFFAKALGSGGDDNNAIAASPSGCVYIGGDFWQVSPFIIGNDSLIRYGAEDVFVAKLCYSQSGESVNEISNTQEFIIYPNPFNNKFTVATKSNGEYEFTLFDITSRVLLRRSFTNSATINTEQLARGIYFYEVKDKNGAREMGKVVKE